MEKSVGFSFLFLFYLMFSLYLITPIYYLYFISSFYIFASFPFYKLLCFDFWGEKFSEESWQFCESPNPKRSHCKRLKVRLKGNALRPAELEDKASVSTCTAAFSGGGAGKSAVSDAEKPK